MRKNSYQTFKEALFFVMGGILAHITTTHAGHIDVTQATTQADEGEGEGEAGVESLASSDDMDYVRWLPAATLVIGGTIALGLATQKLGVSRVGEDLREYVFLNPVAGESTSENTSRDVEMNTGTSGATEATGMFANIIPEVDEMTKTLMAIVAGAGIATYDVGTDFGVALPTLYVNEENKWAFSVQIFIIAAASIGGAILFVTEFDMWRNVHINAAVKPAIIIGSCIAFPFFPPSVLVTGFVAWLLKDNDLLLKCKDALLIIGEGEIVESLYGLAFQSDLFFREGVTGLFKSMIPALLSSSYTLVGINTQKKVLLSITLKSKRSEQDDKQFRIITGPLAELGAAKAAVLLMAIHYILELLSGIGCIILSQYFLHDYFIGPALPVAGFTRYSVAWAAFICIQGVCFLAITLSLIPTSRLHCFHISVISSMAIELPVLDKNLQLMPLYGVRLGSQAVIAIAAYTNRFLVDGKNDEARSLAWLMIITVAASACMWFTLFLLRHFFAYSQPLAWQEGEIRKTAADLHNSASQRAEWEFADFRLSSQAGQHPQVQYLIKVLMVNIFDPNVNVVCFGQVPAEYYYVKSSVDAWVLLEYLQYLQSGEEEVKVEFHMEFDDPTWLGNMMANNQTRKDALKHYLNLVDTDQSRLDPCLKQVHRAFDGKPAELCKIINKYTESEVKHGGLFAFAVAEKKLAQADKQFKDVYKEVRRKAEAAEFYYAKQQLGSSILENALLKHSQVTLEFKGPMGIVYDDAGIVTSVIENEPAHRRGIRNGHVVVKVGPSSFSKARLATAERSESEYVVTVRTHNHERLTEEMIECKKRQDAEANLQAAMDEQGSKALKDALNMYEDVFVDKKSYEEELKKREAVETADLKTAEAVEKTNIEANRKELSNKYVHEHRLVMDNYPGESIDKILKEIAQQHPDLQEIHLRNTPVTDEGLKAWSTENMPLSKKGMEVLLNAWCEGTKEYEVRFDIFKKLLDGPDEQVACDAKCASLRFIDLRGCSQITKKGVQELCEAAPFLQKVICESFIAEDLQARYKQISFEKALSRQ